MFKKSIFMFLFFVYSTFLQAEEWCVIIAKSCIAKNETLETQNISLKNIYLKKQRFIGNCSISPLNLNSQYSIRTYFTKEILNISAKSWKRYYNEMHFKGVTPPHVVSSVESMLKYLENIQGAIGYVPHSAMNTEVLATFNIIKKFEYDEKH